MEGYSRTHHVNDVISGGGTNHLMAFNKTEEIFSAPGNRPCVPDIVILITDGDPPNFNASAMAVSI